MDSNKKIANLDSMSLGADNIYSCLQPETSSDQREEIAFREKVASQTHGDYFEKLSQSHSISVMDQEVRKFLTCIPRNGVILDVGGCWGWHWRYLKQQRPDVSVVILDFIRSNLLHARRLLADQENPSIFLVHGDATNLHFPDHSFDAVWTVQTLQHISFFEQAVKEAYRVLKHGGRFANYSLNIQPHVALIYRLLGKKYVTNGFVNGNYWLARASQTQKQQIEQIFGAQVTERWTEILYSPELRFAFPGRKGNLLGKLDAKLSNNWGLLRWFARQH